jgi:hypothetical protein
MKKIYLSVCLVLLSLPSLFAQCNTFAQVTSNISCFGRCDGAASAFAFGGAAPYVYTWSPGNLTGPSVTGLCPGTYTVTSTDSKGCKSTSTPVTITSPPKLSLSFSHTNVTCNMGTNGSSTVTVSGGTPAYTYSWNSNPSQTTAKASNLKAGIYAVSVTDANLCKASGFDTIQQPVAIIISTTATNATCGKSDGQATASAANGVAPYTYSWNTNPVQTAATATTLAAGIYAVTATDANGCTQTTSVTVNNVNGPTASATSTDVSCFAGTNGTASATVKGGTVPYTYSWNSNPIQTTAAATGLTANSYTFTVTDKAGCMAQATAVINQPSALTAITSGINISCNGGSTGRVTANASGGNAPYSYSWNTVPAQTKDTVTALKAGTYTVTITDANGCTLQKSVTLTEPGTAISTVSTLVNVTCNGGNNGSAKETVSGGTPGYTYLWNTNPPQFSNRITTMKAGIYTLTVTDAAGCKFIKADTIREPAPLVIVASSTNSNCGKTNGSATAKVSGGTRGYAYSWNTNPVQTTATATTLAAGVYTVTVTDTLGCIKTAVDTVKNLNAPVLSVSSSNVSCLGAKNGTATVAVTGGTAPISISWSSTPVQTTATATGLAAGTYTVTVTDNAGCSTQATVTISAPKAITISNTSKNVSCFGGKDGNILVTLSGGTYPYTQLWKPSKDTSLSLKNIGAGSDTIIVTDANGCQNLKAISVSQPTAIAATTIQTNVSCNGGNNGSATVSASGGTGPYTYLWNTVPAQTNTTASGLSATSYTVLIKDFNSCPYISNVTISQPAAIVLSTTVTNSNCGQSNGQIAVAASGGMAPFTYSWNTNPAQTSATATALAVGIYKATVTDSKNCVKAISDTVKNLNAPTIVLTSTNVSCFGAKNGTATIKASGGTAPYTYSWNTNPVSTTAVITTLGAGSYTGTVTDNAGCASLATATITEPAALVVSVKQTNVSCNKGNNGSAIATVTGGTSPYTYLWSGAGGTAATATGLVAGNDTIKITDGNGCTASQIITITEPTALTGSVIHTNVSCNGGNNGSATVTASGGTGSSYSYWWSTNPAQSGTTAIGLNAGTYTVSISDGNKCSVNASVTITEPAAMVLSTNSVSSNCSQSTGQAIVAVSGGSSPYTFYWNSNPAQNTSTATALPAGIYTVTVTDSKSCKGTASATVNNLNAATITTTSTNVSCFGGANGAASATASGGTAPLSYSWNTKVVQTTPSVSGLSAGSYTVTVKDNAGCISNALVSITQPTAALSTSMTATNATCAGCKDGTAAVKVAGGSSAYSYVWSPGGSTTASLTGLGAGKYKVCITDSKGCGTCDSIVVTQPVATGLNTNDAVASINVYPNPNNGSFVIILETGSKQTFSIKVMNAIGQVVAEQKAETIGTLQIPMELNHAEGIYFIKIQSDKELFTKRIVVNK